MVVAVGQQAPDFELRDQAMQSVRLSSYRGKKVVVLVFYPLTFTSVCGAEMCAIRDDLPSFVNDDVQTLALSVDSAFSHRVWAEREGFDFPLLADFWPHGQVARDYGVFDDEMGVSLRGTFVIDIEGVVRHVVVNAIPDARDAADLARVIGELSAAA